MSSLLSVAPARPASPRERTPLEVARRAEYLGELFQARRAEERLRRLLTQGAAA